MGLDTDYDCWNGPYSSFNAWRRKVAAAIGMDLRQMEGFGGEGRWYYLAPDPLHVLLSHSDCDGDIPADKCAALADRLEQIMPTLAGNDHFLDDSTTRAKAAKFVAGLREAVRDGKGVEFY